MTFCHADNRVRLSKKDGDTALTKSEYELVPRGDAPNDAAMSLCISDDCMQPYIGAGECVYVSVGSPPEEFGVGVFMYEGRVLCRQWCESYSGALMLLAANPARQSENVIIPPSKRDKLVCLGRIITDKPLPRPRYV